MCAESSFRLSQSPRFIKEIYNAIPLLTAQKSHVVEDQFDVPFDLLALAKAPGPRPVHRLLF